MRNILFTFFALTTIVLSNCGNSTQKDVAKNVTQLTDTGKAEIVFKEYEHDFGIVSEGEKLGFTFTFMNKGTGSLVIASATTSCGCTVPKFDTRPVSPDGHGKLEVVFNTSGRNGMQTKTITVKSNAIVPVVLLRIKAEVVSNNN